MRNEEKCVCSRCDIFISGKIIKETPGSVASGTPCITRVSTMQYNGTVEYCACLVCCHSLEKTRRAL